MKRTIRNASVGAAVLSPEKAMHQCLESSLSSTLVVEHSILSSNSHDFLRLNRERLRRKSLSSSNCCGYSSATNVVSLPRNHYVGWWIVELLLLLIFPATFFSTSAIVLAVDAVADGACLGNKSSWASFSSSTSRRSIASKTQIDTSLSQPRQRDPRPSWRVLAFVDGWKRQLQQQQPPRKSQQHPRQPHQHHRRQQQIKLPHPNQLANPILNSNVAAAAAHLPQWSAVQGRRGEGGRAHRIAVVVTVARNVSFARSSSSCLSGIAPSASISSSRGSSWGKRRIENHPGEASVSCMNGSDAFQRHSRLKMSLQLQQQQQKQHRRYLAPWKWRFWVRGGGATNLIARRRRGISPPPPALVADMHQRPLYLVSDEITPSNSQGWLDRRQTDQHQPSMDWYHRFLCWWWACRRQLPLFPWLPRNPCATASQKRQQLSPKEYPTFSTSSSSSSSPVMPIWMVSSASWIGSGCWSMLDDDHNYIEATEIQRWPNKTDDVVSTLAWLAAEQQQQHPSSQNHPPRLRRFFPDRMQNEINNHLADGQKEDAAFPKDPLPDTMVNPMATSLDEASSASSTTISSSSGPVHLIHPSNLESGTDRQPNQNNNNNDDDNDRDKKHASESADPACIDCENSNKDDDGDDEPKAITVHTYVDPSTRETWMALHTPEPKFRAFLRHHGLLIVNAVKAKTTTATTSTNTSDAPHGTIQISYCRIPALQSSSSPSERNDDDNKTLLLESKSTAKTKTSQPIQQQQQETSSFRVVPPLRHSKDEWRRLWHAGRLLTDRTEWLAIYPSDTAAKHNKNKDNDNKNPETSKQTSRRVRSRRGGFDDLLHLYTDRMLGILADEQDEWRQGTAAASANNCTSLVHWLEKHYGAAETAEIQAQQLHRTTPAQQFATLRHFLEWFRQTFPYYYDRCSRCGASIKEDLAAGVFATPSPSPSSPPGANLSRRSRSSSSNSSNNPTVVQWEDKEPPIATATASAPSTTTARNIPTTGINGARVPNPETPRLGSNAAVAEEEDQEQLPTQQLQEHQTFLGYIYPCQEELLGKASRTELYQCHRCQAFTRFPRYNAAQYVLQHQRGRCGEYSMLLLRMLRALGHECRWVVDWADHVWVEIALLARTEHDFQTSDPSKSGSSRTIEQIKERSASKAASTCSSLPYQWVHLDPCEAAAGQNLLYQGWGKKQTYILGFYAPSREKLMAWSNNPVTTTRSDHDDNTDGRRCNDMTAQANHYGDITSAAFEFPLIEDITTSYTTASLATIQARREESVEEVQESIAKATCRLQRNLHDFYAAAAADDSSRLDDAATRTAATLLPSSSSLSPISTISNTITQSSNVAQPQ